MDATWHTWLETIFYIVIDSKIALNKICELLDDFLAILIQKSLQFWNILKLIEVFFEFCIQVLENAYILLKNLK